MRDEGLLLTQSGHRRLKIAAARHACAANAIALAIPCHRVVRSDGALAGYRWGAERKRRMVEKEAEALT